MKVKTIRYCKKFNLGDYENEDIEITATVEEGDDPKEILKKLKKDVENMHRGP